MVTPSSPADVVRGAQRARLPARRGVGHEHLPGALAAATAAARGRGRRRQDRGGQGARPLDRRRADPPAVLRGHRRQPGRLRLGLLPPAAPPARRRGHRRGHRRGTDALEARAVPRALPAQAGRCCRRSTTRRRAAAGAAHRRDRPGRRRVRGVPAGGAVRLPDHRARARPVHRRPPADRRADVEPHPRRARRAEAPLPVPLGRAPRLRPRGRHRAPARARTSIEPLARQVAARGRVAARPQPVQAARRRRDDRLGAGARPRSACRRSTSAPSTPRSARCSSTARTRSGPASTASPTSSSTPSSATARAVRAEHGARTHRRRLRPRAARRRARRADRCGDDLRRGAWPRSASTSATPCTGPGGRRWCATRRTSRSTTGPSPCSGSGVAPTCLGSSRRSQRITLAIDDEDGAEGDDDERRDQRPTRSSSCASPPRRCCATRTSPPTTTTSCASPSS